MLDGSGYTMASEMMLMLCQSAITEKLVEIGPTLDPRAIRKLNDNYMY